MHPPPPHPLAGYTFLPLFVTCTKVNINAEVDFWEKQFSVSDKNHLGKYFEFANNDYLPET